MLTIQSLPRTGTAFLLCIGLFLSAALQVRAAGVPDYPVKLSTDGSYLVDQSNRPFFINGDTAWSLIAQLSKQDAELYLSDRAAKGFNVVLVSLIEHSFANNAPSNLAGDAPFTTAGNFGTPNEAYFAHADWVINKAAEKGITVLLAPLYLGFGCGSEGWCTEVKASSLTTMGNYGRYVGNRYKNVPNIIWLIGGDTDPVADGVGPRVQAFVAGIKEVDPNHLFTAHNAPEQAAMDVWPNEAWLNLNNIYTYNNTPSAALAQYNRSNRKPFFLLETAYEREHDSTPLSLRRQAYWSVLSGGIAGHMFGNCPIWNFGAAAASGFCASATWQSQLNSAGSTTLANVGRLFSTRAFYKLVPDQAHEVLINGLQSGSTYAMAARASDGSTIIAYVPTSRSVTVDLSKISGTSAKAWWFNPRTAVASPIGVYHSSGTMTFTPPSSDDWVLVIDNASLNLPAPGSLVQQLPAPINLRVIEVR